MLVVTTSVDSKMQTAKNIFTREANVEEEILIAEHFYKMWLDIGIPEDAIEENWQQIILNFIENARQNLSYQAFVVEVDGIIVISRLLTNPPVQE